MNVFKPLINTSLQKYTFLIDKKVSMWYFD